MNNRVPINIPYNPTKEPSNKKISFHILIELTISLSLNKNDATDDIAITMIMIGDIRPASTAAWPKTKAPTIDIDEPTTNGTLVSASLSISKLSQRSNASIKDGKGTPSLCILKLIRTEVGSVSWLKVVNAIYKPGIIIAIINDINLIILGYIIFILFW